MTAGELPPLSVWSREPHSTLSVRWWQGIAFHLNDSMINGSEKGTMRAPLLGVDLSQQSALVTAKSPNPTLISCLVPHFC
jgi:hypothetical protein